MAADARASPDVLLYTEWASKDRYKQLLEERGLNVVYPGDVADWEAIRFAVAWKPPPGLLTQCRNLEAAMSLGAGVDHILQPGQVPDRVPVLRIVDPRMAERMATWVVWGVINWQRRFEAYLEAQRAARWDLGIEGRTNRDNCDVSVGVMGFGVMGRATAEALAALGYKVSAWSRTARQHGAVRCFHGSGQLREFVSGADVLVCLLPLTDDTRGIVDARLLSWLPRGGAVINGARGAHLVEADLLAALDSEQVGFALLDVFATEPLPADSPLWSHPRVRLTPHVASMTTLEGAADQIAANYHSVVAGRGPLPVNLIDRTAGY
ncbi:glyoxylate hydroxypyruvate reductase A [Raphidocelis subcapitata]|uniref:Glyoxylate hydroxypyruvate reductase A n=1 Tax=Raphidocelis subcapitata TaxID=307507 RepID=A0A2V0P8B6_9CHLO|nr:glyoxylate hydroxypyruvate reductase A [Raphidocelis subcapitata]|eukprot:GBF95182.1 glyoxylate hydroxypyruvate reductase A [Raphidocelis subcapitata]